MNKINIFLDLDGTVLNNSSRLYSLHKDLIRIFKKKPLSIKKYWSLKRNSFPENKIASGCLGNDVSLVKKYMHKRERFIESRHYLEMDKIPSGCLGALRILSKRSNLFLLTARRNKKNLVWELKRNNLMGTFAGILCGFEKNIPVWKIKTKLLRDNKFCNGSGSVIVGDTEAELLCARELGFVSVALTGGIRTKKHLLKFTPDIICKDVNAMAKKWRIICEKTNQN